MSEKKYNFEVKATDNENLRLDKFLALKLKKYGISRSEIQKLIRAKEISVNSRTFSQSHFLKVGDSVDVNLPKKEERQTLPEEMPLDILLEDDNILIINKPSGLVTHPASGNFSGTLVNGLLHYCKKLSDFGGEDRLGIVHRLDKDTSGCIIIAKNNKNHSKLSKQFASRKVKKTYFAVVDALPQISNADSVNSSDNDTKFGQIKSYMGRNPANRLKMTNLDETAGKLAITDWELQAHNPDTKISLIKCQPLTGRTHQLRVHMKENLHCPILGECIYETRASARKSLNLKISRLMLHAYSITFIHPANGEIISAKANLPAEFLNLFEQINPL